jgi:hypothetical protein
MDQIFQARHWTPTRYRETQRQDDYENEAEARKVIETAGAGELVKFRCYPNLPGALPLVTHSSVWMETFSDGVWKEQNIF